MARLAADGLTNPEIARELFVNVKTVEKHLGQVYRLRREARRRQPGRRGGFGQRRVLAFRQPQIDTPLSARPAVRAVPTTPPLLFAHSHLGLFAVGRPRRVGPVARPRRVEPSETVTGSEAPQGRRFGNRTHILLPPEGPFREDKRRV